MLTERRAWQKLAKKYAAIKTEEEALKQWGLCSEIDVRISEEVALDVSDRMHLAIKPKPTSSSKWRHWPYRWDLTLAGARQREKFCLAQVARLTKTAHKRKKGKK